ncbi:S9 family peptidase [Duganella sp. LX20W]|uniref:S9 family peptidase n=1 Tax=Rugamonas brunnea TaxID=2758569 RepID=A0A7W2ID93_9BURK|nr:S9 family peptidase [Rugamonas brunnea]MBA5639073.1 S9 family peptidase [Rugamonas brunnea]
MPSLSHPMLRACALACALVVGGAALPAAAAATALPPLSAFFDNETFSDAKLSPDGNFLAARLCTKGERAWLSVLDLNTKQLKVVAQLRDADIGQFQWVNDKRLVFNAYDSRSAQGEQFYGPGLYAVDRDGGKFRQLADRSGDVTETTDMRKMLPWNTFMLDETGPQDSDYYYAVNSKYDEQYRFNNLSLMRVNTVTGQSSFVEQPSKWRDIWLDQHGQARVASMSDSETQTLSYRDPASGAWRTLATFKRYDPEAARFWPLAFGPDGTLYVVSANGKDKEALYTYDLAAGRMASEPLLSLPDFDFTGSLIMDQHKLLGVRYTNDAENTLWFDPGMKAMQAAVDALLPDTINLLTPATRGSAPRVLVRAFSDTKPGTFYLYDGQAKALARLGLSRPGIEPSQMGEQNLVRYQARDGLTIPAWLTLPAGKSKNLPMVVLVHGGPYVRGGQWGWNPEAQFLASRGYAVLEPEYRGSTGFGTHHFHAGWKQWGLKMQDDVADGTRWAIAQGIADGKRVCIAGASYGGYATLMGLVNDPDLYRCGVDWVGVTDINLLYTDNSWYDDSAMSSEWRRYGMRRLVGDPDKDAAQLRTTSPLQQAARIKQPLLLAYGGVDYRVPLVHGNKFRDAVSATNKDVEWVVYPKEGHGWVLPENRIDFWGRVEKFLDRNIGQHGEAAGGQH